MNFAFDLMTRLLMPKPPRKTVEVVENSPMIVNLSVLPDGWWLYGLFHNHTPIRYAGEAHLTFDESGHGDPWSCKLQRREGGLLTEGSGLTPQQAVLSAVQEVELRYMDAGEER